MGMAIFGFKQPNGLGCARRVEMSRADLGAPAGDRHQRYVDRPDAGQVVEQVRVAGEVNGCEPGDLEAELARSSERAAGVLVLRVDARHGQAADVNVLALGERRDVSEPLSA